MDKERNVPKIRFGSYDDNLIINEIGNLINRKKSFSLPRTYETKHDTGIKYVHYGDIHLGIAKLIKKNNNLPNIKNGSYSQTLERGDLILADASEDYKGIGSPSVLVEQPAETIIAGLHTIAFSPTNIDPIYCYYLLNTDRYKNYMRIKCTGAKVYGITFNNFKEFNVHAPIREEQQKIGNFFQNLDKKLEIEKEKHEKLMGFKKAMLEDMFPKEGEKVPKIRFDGFDDEWEESSLGEIGKKYTSITGKTKEDFGHGDGRYVTFSNALANPVAKLDGVEQIEIDDNQNSIKKGDIFFNISSETYEEVGMSSVWVYDTENYYLNSFCMGFRPNIDLNNYFITYLLRSSYSRKQIMKLAQGISRINISQNKLLEISILMPTVEEQNLIGSFFQNLDEKIDLSSKKIKKIEDFKKSMLDKMFV